jgi:hypothetical protein
MKHIKVNVTYKLQVTSKGKDLWRGFDSDDNLGSLMSIKSKRSAQLPDLDFRIIELKTIETEL